MKSSSKLNLKISAYPQVLNETTQDTFAYPCLRPSKYEGRIKHVYVTVTYIEPSDFSRDVRCPWTSISLTSSQYLCLLPYLCYSLAYSLLP